MTEVGARARYRVIQWATGSVGREALKAILIHPSLAKPRDGWTVSIEGDPSFQTRFLSMASFRRRDATIDEHVQAANVATAMQAVNSVPALCEAEPGWRSSVELGLVSTAIGFRPAPG